MNKAFAERAGEPRKLLLTNKYKGFSEYVFCWRSSKRVKKRVIFKNKHENKHENF